MHIAVVLDCADPEGLAQFWAEALGYRRQPLEEPYLMLLPAQRGGGPGLTLQRVPEPKADKNRMHIDLHVEDVDREVARLVALGATRGRFNTSTGSVVGWGEPEAGSTVRPTRSASASGLATTGRVWPLESGRRRPAGRTARGPMSQSS